MSDSIDPADRTAIEGIVAKLEAAWNAGDGVAFGELFHTAMFSAVLTGATNGWEIASFHNTLAPPARG